MKRASSFCCHKSQELSEKKVSQSEEINLYYTHAKRYFSISTLITLLLLTFASDLPFFQCALGSMIIFWPALPFFKDGFQKNEPLNMFSLVSIGILAAYLYSISTLIWKTNEPLYFESLAMITSLVWLGQMVESKAMLKTTQEIERLFKSRPITALRITDKKEEIIALQDVQEQDILRVRPGDTIPVDGVVLEGISTVDESLMTGESMPRTKEKGALLLGGSFNCEGMLFMQATSTGKNSYFSKIETLVEDAKVTKAPITRLADTISRYFTVTVFGIAGTTFLIWAFLIPGFSITQALLSAISVLIIACPCALGLATPLAISLALQKSAQIGALIKHASVFEKLDKISTVLFDKTGTLTSRTPEVASFTTQSAQEDLIYAISHLSHHPYAKAISRFLQPKIQLPLQECHHFSEVIGKGMQGEVNGKKIQIGSKKWLLSNTTLIPESAIAVVIDNTYIGHFLMKEELQPTAKALISDLNSMHLSSAMLTGDSLFRATSIAKALSIPHIHAELLPEDKAQLVTEYSKKGKVAMIGDGINDAPALVKSYVSVAMGCGSDFAIKQADMVLMGQDLRTFIKSLKIAKQTMHIVRQNLAFAFGYNIIGIAFAAGLFYPFFGLFLHPVIASLAMVLSSISVLANTFRLQKKSF